MEARMTYRQGERDLVVLVDEVTLDGGNRTPRAPAPRALAATIVARGEAHGETAMARLVGVPAGLAACRILDRTIDAVGVHVPVEPRLVRTLLDDLAHAGIEAQLTERSIAESES
jgi:saccharopine dehydrogenase (NADP+, L-glutamate forming)